MELTVNGKGVSVASDAATPLLHVLRDEIGLRAARFGCGQGTCGACTVIVDRKAVLSCDVPVGELSGARIETAESLAGTTRHPLLDAFLEKQAGQCGFCLSGILMAAKALLDAERAPSRERIAAALDANLCRCGAHGRILDAVEATVVAMKEGAA